MTSWRKQISLSYISDRNLRLSSRAKFTRIGFSPFLSLSLASYPLSFKSFIPKTCLELRALYCKVFLLIPSLEFMPFGGDGALLIASAVLDCYRALEQNCAAWAFVLCKITPRPYRMEGLTSLTFLICFELFSAPYSSRAQRSWR